MIEHPTSLDQYSPILLQLESAGLLVATTR
jgi:hypothetical protein